MEASNIVWEKWQEQVTDLLPTIHGHQKKTLALSVLGIVLSKRAVFQRMAESVYLQGISQAKMTSIERRFARFGASERIHVKTIWSELLKQLLPFWKGKAVQLVLDCTPFDDRATMVYLGRLLHSRVLPVAWRVMPSQEKWDQGQWELVGELLDEVKAHWEPTDCTLIADRGLAGAPLVKLCRDRKVHYLLRVCKEHTCRRRLGQNWRAWTDARPHHSERRTAVVWTRVALARRADDRDAPECSLGQRAQRSLVSDFRPACRPRARARLCATHACRGDLPGWQKPWLELGGEPDCRPGTAGSPTVGLIYRHVVGHALGCLLHPSWAARSV